MKLLPLVARNKWQIGADLMGSRKARERANARKSQLHTLINLAEDNNTRELGLGVAFKLGVEDEDAYGGSAGHPGGGKGQCSRMSPPAWVGTSLWVSSINILNSGLEGRTACEESAARGGRERYLTPNDPHLPPQARFPRRSQIRPHLCTPHLRLLFLCPELHTSDFVNRHHALTS